MNNNIKRRTFAQWLRDVLIIYILPGCVIWYVNYTKCWPYHMLHNFYKGKPKAGYIPDEIVTSTAVLIFAGIYYGSIYLFKRFFKKP